MPGLMQGLRDWGDEHPKTRAVVGFVPGVGQLLDVADITDPNASWGERGLDAALATPWGKVGKLAKALRGARPARAARGLDEVDDMTQEELRALEQTVFENRDRVPGMTSDAAEAEVLAESLRNIRRAAVPVGAGMLGVAGAAKYMDERKQKQK